MIRTASHMPHVWRFSTIDASMRQSDIGRRNVLRQLARQNGDAPRTVEK